MSAERVAVICVVGEMLLATISNVLLRLAAVDLPPESTLFLRLVLTSAMIAPLLAMRPGAREATVRVLTNRPRLGRYVACGVVSYIASITWLYALLKLPIAVATSLFFTTAIFMGLMSRVWLADAFTLRNWIALGAGLAGVMIVLHPSMDGVTGTGIAAALIAAALSALGKLQLKMLSGPEPPVVSAFLRLAPVIPFAALPVLGMRALPSSPSSVLFIALAALLFAVGHTAIARGYAIFSLSQAAVLEYLRLLFATTAGVLVFAEPIGVTTLMGGAVILAAALLGTGKRVHPYATVMEPKRHGS